MRKRYPVYLNPRAVRQFRGADAWWRTYRPGAPDALRDELRAARELLTYAPYAGQVDEEHDNVRRLLLPTTRYHVYYAVYDEPGRTSRVVILQLWHASREAPDL